MQPWNKKIWRSEEIVMFRYQNQMVCLLVLSEPQLLEFALLGGRSCSGWDFSVHDARRTKNGASLTPVQLGFPIPTSINSFLSQQPAAALISLAIALTSLKPHNPKCSTEGRQHVDTSSIFELNILKLVPVVGLLDQNPSSDPTWFNACHYHMVFFVHGSCGRTLLITHLVVLCRASQDWRQVAMCNSHQYFTLSTMAVALPDSFATPQRVESLSLPSR